MEYQSPTLSPRRGSRPMFQRRSSKSKMGAFQSITARKSKPSDPFGVSIKEIEGRAIITEITPDSIFADSGLEVGDMLLSLNGQSTKEAFLTDLVETANEAEDKVTMVVRQKSAVSLLVQSPQKRLSSRSLTGELKVEKDKRLQDVGIRFKVKDNKLMVSKILRDSIFQDTDLEVGDLVAKINECDFHSYADADYALRVANKRGTSVKLQLRPRNE